MIKIKTHSFPGDFSKSSKINMMEKEKNKKAKSFKRMILSRMRAVLKERTRKEINDA